MELELRDLVRIVRKRLGLLLSMIAVACIATAVVSYWFLTPVYEASTKIIVNRQNPSILDQLNINDINANVRLVDTYKEIIRTPYIMELVAKEHPEFALTAEELIRKVRVSSVNNTQVMTVIAEDADYVKAARIANAVSEVFQREIPKIMSVDNVSILSEARLDVQPAPVRPKPALNIAISFVVAAMAGMGLIFLLEYLDDTIKTEEDVRVVLGLPTLGIIAKIPPQELQAAAGEAKATEPMGETTHAAHVTTRR